MRILLFLLLLALGGGAFTPAQAATKNEGRFNFLTRFFDLNETAFAFHKHCVSKDRLPDPVFMKNLDYVADALLREMTVRFPNQDPERLKANVMGRRYAIQQKLDGYYYGNGCESEGALSAEAHYQQFRAIDTGAVRDFIVERTGG